VRLGARLRRLRRERGVSQNELKRRSGLQSSYLSKIENDVMLPGLQNLDRIARALGLSLAEIVPAGRGRQRATPRAGPSRARG
jgi:transcriptional regulator with XRE-family HTH domain